MSNTVLGADCCGDRYECNTTTRCKCGCTLAYCRSCYDAHMRTVGEKLLKNPAYRGKPPRPQPKPRRPGKKPTDRCANRICGHTRIRHVFGKSYTTKEGYYHVNILKNGGGGCGEDDEWGAPGEPGPCCCKKFEEPNR